MAWTGDQWNPEDFISDIEMLAEDTGLIESSNDDSDDWLAVSPTLVFGLSALLALGLAAIAINVSSKSNNEK